MHGVEERCCETEDEGKLGIGKSIWQQGFENRYM